MAICYMNVYPLHCRSTDWFIYVDPEIQCTCVLTCVCVCVCTCRLFWKITNKRGGGVRIHTNKVKKHLSSDRSIWKSINQRSDRSVIIVLPPKGRRQSLSTPPVRHTSEISKVFALRYGTALLGNAHQLLRILARQSLGQASTGCKGSRKLQKRLHVEVRTGCHLSLLTVSLEDVWKVEDRALQRKNIMII